MNDDSLDLGSGNVLAEQRASIDTALDALLAKLDPDQRGLVGALVNGTGNLHGIACAGAGKTTTLIAGIGALLRAGVQARDVVATTFTSKAGKELQDRLAAVVHPGDLASLRVGTFHGLALRALRSAGVPGFSSMQRCMDIGKRAEGVPASKMLWGRILGWDTIPELGNCRGLDLNLTERGLAVGDYALAADLIRSRNIDYRSRTARAEAEEVALPAFWRAWSMYEDAKASVEAWDFADALAAYRDGLASGSIRDRAAIVIVDETQDNSLAQTEIAALLARNGRLCVVGDGRQAIYSWRGAAPEFFLGFAEKFNATRAELPNNYRSADRIVAIGNAVAEGKPWSVGAAAVPMRQIEGTVDVIGGYASPFAEAEAVAERVARSMQEGERADAYAVLSRTNAVLGAFEAAFVRARIPCIVVGGTPFFQRKEVQDVLAYAVLIEHDSVNQLDRVCNKPKRFLGKAFMDAIRNAHRAGDSIVATIHRIAPTLRSSRGANDLAADIERLRAAGWPTAEDMRGRVEADGSRGAPNLKALGLIQGLLSPPEREEDGGEADNDVRGMYAAAVGIAATFRSARELLEFAVLCGGIVQGIGEGDVAKAATGKVVLSTVFRAKGLEWRHVVVSASEGVFPHIRSIRAATKGDPSRMTEEERLFYVAATRARDALTFSWSKVDVYGRPAGPSRLLAYVEPYRTDREPEGPKSGPKGGPKGGSGAPDDGPDGVGDIADGDDPAMGGTGLSTSAGESPVACGEGERARADGLEASPPFAAACALAASRTAAEPHAAPGGGEGSRFVEVTAESFGELLEPLGATEDVAAGQRVWDLPLGHGLWIRTYSTIALGAQVAREVGEDSIRVVVLYRHAEGEPERPALAKDAWVCRTRGWRGSLLDRIARDAGALSTATPCRYCGAPTTERKGPQGPFLGCIRWKACRDERAGGAR